MPKGEKKWLVRTRGGNFLGPYTESELISEVNAGVFSPDDEIAPSGGYWVSAQKLVNREDTEFTRTSTRQTNTTKSISIAPQQNLPPNGEVPQVEGNLARAPMHAMPQFPPSQPASRPKTQRPILVLLFVALVVVISILFRMVSSKNPVGPDTPQVALGTEENSPFIKQVYDLIRAGERTKALNLLIQKHQTKASQDELAYHIPYAGLLISNRIFPRAQKLLNQVLSSPKASKSLKAKAHRWWGYMLLSQDKDDFGVDHFLQALLLDAQDTASKFNLGRAYMKQERPKEALEYFELAELDNPDLWLIKIFKGHAKVELNKDDEARYNLRRATEISSERWLAYIYYALFLNGVAAEHEEAQAVLRTMLTKDPFHERNNPAPFGYYIIEENYNEYLPVFGKVMKKGSPKIWSLGRLYIRYLANYPNAVEGKRILKSAQTGDLLHRVIALKILIESNAPKRALRAALGRLPSNLEDFGYYAYVVRGDALMQMGDVKQAGINFKRALQLGPKTAISRYSHAEWLRVTGRTRDAEEELKRILTYHPNYIPAIRALRKFH